MSAKNQNRKKNLNDGQFSRVTQVARNKVKKGKLDKKKSKCEACLDARCVVDVEGKR